MLNGPFKYCGRGSCGMVDTHQVHVRRFAQLTAGDLFLLLDGHCRCVALCVDSPTDSDKLMVPIGPNLPSHLKGPALVEGPRATVISFGTSFSVRLPVEPDSWMENEPGHDVPALAVTDEGGIYLRAQYAGFGSQPVYCFVSIADGTICANATSYTPPKGTKAYAIAWEFITTEAIPRVIVKAPFS